MQTANDLESDIKSWLKVVLKDENIEDFSLKVVGNSEKGDGYAGDIFFVTLNSNKDKQKNYDFVLKCSKRSEAARKKLPLKEVFQNEIYIYDIVLPAFNQFQEERGITDPFDSIPKCYGTVVTDNMEIIVLENLKKIGYSLWNKREPLTRKHIDMIIGEYAKLHAISVAMNGLEPEKFKKLISGLTDVFKLFIKATDFEKVFEKNIDEISDLLQGELHETILLKWKTLKQKVHFVFSDMVENIKGLKVILHGDSWSNNFLFKHDADKEAEPLKVAVLDWQISKCSSPVLDLSYFLFASISKEDIEDLDDILRHYYNTLEFLVKKLGSNLGTYSFEEFLHDWKKYCKFGIVMSSAVFQACSTDKDEVVDISEAVENGGDFSQLFSYEVKDKSCFKNRSSHIVKYAVENGLI